MGVTGGRKGGREGGSERGCDESRWVWKLWKVCVCVCVCVCVGEAFAQLIGNYM